MADSALRQDREAEGSAAVAVHPVTAARVRPGDRPGSRLLDLTVVMPTVDFGDDFQAAAGRVLQCLDRTAAAAEFVVAIDGPSVVRPAWLDRPDVRVVATGVRSGPAAARNLAVDHAEGDILFFVDADVELAVDALERVLAAFAAESELVGVFGAYDDEPAAPGIVSQFRNLLHHHTHVSHPGRATTFWTGCGAMRTANFLDVGGFDVGFSCPSIEDIDLGMRVTAAGGRIEIDPSVRCKHLKRWTLASMIATDVFQRAAPWTKLLVARRDMPATLNIDWRNRTCGILATALVAAVITTPFFPVAAAVATACGMAIIACQCGFYRLCLRKRGLLFAVAAFALHMLFFVYSSITFGIIALRSYARPTRRPAAVGDLA